MKRLYLICFALVIFASSTGALGQEMMGPPAPQPRPMAPGMMGPQMMGPGPGMMGMMGRGMGPMMGMMPSPGMHPWWSGRPRRGPGFFLGLREELGLSEGQLTQLREVRSSYLKEAVQKQAAARVAEIEFRELLTKDPWEVARAEEKIKEISTLRTEGRLARLRALAKAREILTPEQRKKYQELQERRLWPRGPHRG